MCHIKIDMNFVFIFINCNEVKYGEEFYNIEIIHNIHGIMKMTSKIVF